MLINQLQLNKTYTLKNNLHNTIENFKVMDKSISEMKLMNLSTKMIKWYDMTELSNYMLIGENNQTNKSLLLG